MHHPKRQHGLTLIELMVTLAVLVVIMAVGLPNFAGTMQSSRLSTASSDLVAGLQTARTEAIRRNLNVVVCRSANLSTCTTGSTWPGWLAFVDANGNGTLDAGEEIIKTSAFDAALQVRVSPAISGGGDSVQFRPNGRALGANEIAMFNGTFLLCVPVTTPPLNARSVSIAFGSRTSVTSLNTSGACSTAPTDS